ncbi:MAG: hypothetical protein EBR30_03450 [Cytophagia bacterium]|nr:hypothetical protein [Cytophagia bacterium]
MLTKDFYGKNGFIWWVGQVEDDEDPLKLGSVRVRIIGVHTEDENLVPTESLPWAQIMLPVTGSNSFTVPRIGDWVFGFFQDGEYAQIPVVMGIFPGIESQQSRTLYQEIVIKKGGENEVPQTPWVGREQGKPITPLEARSAGTVEGTVVNATNQVRSHVCDITPEVTKAVAYIKGQFGVVLEKIREAIRKILDVLGLNPSPSSWFTQQAKALVRLLQKVTKAIKDINDQLVSLLKVAQTIRAVIDYITSLPEKARRFLTECVTKFLAALAQGFADLFIKPITGASFGAFSEIQQSFNEISGAAKGLLAETGRLISMPAQFVGTLLTPSSPDSLNSIERQLKGHVNAITTTGTTIHNRNVVSANTVGQVI